MTSVIIRRVESRLERMVAPGNAGLKVSEALRAASENLQSIETICLEELDERLRPVLDFIGRPGTVRPTDAELQALIDHADRALTACGGLDKPHLGRALIMLCAMADALRHSNFWPAGALDPALGLVALFRHQSLPDRDSAVLLEQLNLCLARYLSHAEILD